MAGKGIAALDRQLMTVNRQLMICCASSARHIRAKTQTAKP